MAERVIHRQWRDENADNRYPFADSASLLTTTGVELQHDTFLDAHLYPIGGEENMYLTAVVISNTEAVFYIGTPTNNQLCTTSFELLDPPAILRLTDAYGRPAGVLVSDVTRLARFQSWPAATHPFDQGSALFAASCCTPTPEVGVRGLVLESGEIFTGDVWIVGELGVLVREQTEDIPGGVRVIRVDIVGDPMFRRTLCKANATSPAGDVPLFSTIPFLKTINGLPPDEFGDFHITTGGNSVSDNVLRIIPTPDRLRFEAVGEETNQ